MDVVRTGKPVALTHLNGPLEQQLDNGTVTEALTGMVIVPGTQLYVRPGVSFQLGGITVPAQARRERCVRLD